jgi:hypothetical protein
LLLSLKPYRPNMRTQWVIPSSPTMPPVSAAVSRRVAISGVQELPGMVSSYMPSFVARGDAPPIETRQVGRPIMCRPFFFHLYFLHPPCRNPKLDLVGTLRLHPPLLRLLPRIHRRCHGQAMSSPSPARFWPADHPSIAPRPAPLTLSPVASDIPTPLTSSKP